MSLGGTVLNMIRQPLTLLSSPTTLCLSVIAAVLYYYFNSKKVNADDWIRYGVKAPKLPWHFFYSADFRSMFRTLIQQYGDIIGTNLNGRMTLVTTNLDLLRHILIKDFNNFVDRSDGFRSNSPFAKSLFFAKSSEWKRQRHISSPAFTSGKLKYISRFVDNSATDLTDYLANCAKTNQLVPIKEITGQYTCEIIAKTAFGLDAKFIGQEDTEFFNYAKNMIRITAPSPLRRFLILFLLRIPYLPSIATYVFKMQFFDPILKEADRYFDVILGNTIAERRKLLKSNEQRSRTDFLDLLLKANEAAAAGKLKTEEEEFKSVEWDQEGKAIQGFSEEEITGLSMLIIFAGMETTATTLQMCLYELAANPDIQEKVVQEISSVVKSESPTADELASLSYTEQVINETLRLYTPVATVTRMAKETRTYNGVTIPKGAVIDIPYFYILKDPKHFPDPEKFDPNRFSPEEKEKRDPLSFVVFGHGPRICLGMRLAYLELKQGLVHVLRKLKVVLNENTEPKKGSDGVKMSNAGLLVPEKPVMLAFELREKS